MGIGGLQFDFSLKTMCLMATSFTFLACGGGGNSSSDVSSEASSEVSQNSTTSSSVTTNSSVAAPDTSRSLLGSSGTFDLGQEGFSVNIEAGAGSVSWGGAAEFSISTSTEESWQIQLIHDVEIVAQQAYTVCFQASGQGSRSIVVNVDSGDPDYTSLMGGEHLLSIGTDWQTISHSFSATAADTTARLTINLGQSDVDVSLDNIGLYRGNECGGDAPPTSQSSVANESSSVSVSSSSPVSSASSSSNSSAAPAIIEPPGCEGAQCSAGTGGYPYGQLLQQSFYFYEAQQSGPLPSWNRVNWRQDSTQNDGNDVGLDLTGGWFDAGDHVKFGFPMAASVTMLAWGAVDYAAAYERSGQKDEMLRNLRFVNDYFIKAHVSPNEFYGQIGDGGSDHAYWGPPEGINFPRPAYKIDLNCPGVDLAAETAAAMASSSMVFASEDSNYSTTLLRHARELFDFAEATVGSDGQDNGYSNCITGSAPFYDSNYGIYFDELAWAAVWMWRATGESTYLDKAKLYYPQMGFEDGTQTPEYTWTQSWGDKAYGVYALMSVLVGDDPKYNTDLFRWLDHWRIGSGDRTPAGLMFVDTWGALRYAANTAFIALYYADRLPPGADNKQALQDFAKRQIDYALGENPRSSSYVVGYGNNPPTHAHHRAASGTGFDADGAPNRYVLYGALVGGPDINDGFTDDRSAYEYTEVTTDYNAGWTSALAALYWAFGGDPVPDNQFPPN